MRNSAVSARLGTGALDLRSVGWGGYRAFRARAARVKSFSFTQSSMP